MGIEYKEIGKGIFIGLCGDNRSTLAQLITEDISSSPVIADRDVTWGDIKKDFDAHYPNTATLVNDYRPFCPFTIILWLKTGAHFLYDYITKEITSV